jgi:hypothetical protein
MSSSLQNSKTMLVAAIQKMAVGVKKRFAGKSIVLDGETVKADDVYAELVAFPDQVAAADDAHAQWTALLAGVRATQKDTITPRMAAMRRMLESFYGPENAALADFGLTPRKKPVRTVAVKQAAQVKGKATRLARHTMGSKQKKAIKGSTAASTAPASAAVKTG